MNKRFTSLMTTLILSVFFAISASAYDVEVDGLYYNIVSGAAEVTHGDKKYVGEIKIPESIKFKKSELKVTKIAEYAFDNCAMLSSVIIPNTITSIGYCSFAGCSDLTNITIPNSVIIIDAESFIDCVNLKSIIISSSVESIGYKAFAWCKKLEDIYCYAEKVPELGYSSFESSLIEYATLHVPGNSIDAYKESSWNIIGNIVAIEGTEIERKQCATPTISYSDDKLHFACETEGAECYYTLNSSDIKSGDTFAEGNTITLGACYDITCYAIATGYKKSDVATAKLYWLQSSGSLETDNINNVTMRGIAIQSAGGFINISGLDNNEKVDFYGLDGKSLGSAKSIDGSVSFSAQQGIIIIAKIGKESVKISVE